MAIEITPFYEPDSGTWTYLVADSENRVGVVIDPVWVFDPVSGRADSSFIEGVLEHARTHNLKIEWVLETHAHADHLTAASEIKKKTGARIGCSKGIRSVQKTFARAFNLAGLATDGSQFDRLFEEGDRLVVGNLEFHVIETPGHTSDSITYRLEDAAFIGDTLFAPAYGSARCDFPGGDAGQLYDSISRLHQLPDETRLFLCHDYPAEGDQPMCQVSVLESRTSNIHIKAETTREAYIKMRRARDAQLSLPRLILPSLQVNIRAGNAPGAEENGVSYLKTPFNRNLNELVRVKDSNQDQ